ncbi:MAG: RDD family protein, partial [Nocardioides sp.]|nr:RDD family protein [Nocardioides sp.]
DWLACLAIAELAVRAGLIAGNPGSIVTMALFVVETAFFTALLGGSFGKLLTRLRVVRLDGRPLGLMSALLRSVMVVLVIPPLVFKPDGRGLHDLLVGTATVPLPR